jgi:ankyrin repeat protein
MCAAVHNRFSIVCKLLDCKRVDVNMSDDHGHTTLMNAAVKGYDSIVVKLLEYNNEEVDVNAAEQNGFTALIAATAGNHDSTVAKLIACKRVDVNARDKLPW